MSYLQSLPPVRIASNVALLSSSWFFMGNLSHVLFGQVPMIQADHVKLDNEQKAQAWQYFYDRAKAPFAGASVLSTLAFSYIAYKVPHLRRLAILGALTSVSIGPYTLIQMMPVNNKLTSIANKDADCKHIQAYTDKLIEAWRKMHSVRMLLGAVSLLTALIVAERA